MMKRAMGMILAAILVVANLAWAQAAKQPPKPGPEQKRLAYFLGSWSGSADMKESPFGPAGKMTYTEHNEWFPGGFFLVSHSEAKSPMGDSKGLAVMGYDTEKKAYTYHAVDSMGMADSATGTVKGDTWTWNSELVFGGKSMKTRFTIKELSPTEQSFKFESSADGKTWNTIMEGKSTKSGAKKPEAKKAPVTK